MRVGPKYKIARRLGERVFSKTQTTKFTISGTGPKGREGGRRPRAASEYGTQLLEKQKARYTYGVSEKQFRNYVLGARRDAGNPAENLFAALERRLDNVVFRLGLVNSRYFARQVVSHGHILVNGRRVTVPSRVVKTGDVIGIRVGSRENAIFRDLAEKLKEYVAPSWLRFDPEKKEGTVIADPLLKEGESNISYRTIIEFYSRV